MDKNISFTLKVWRQKGPKAKGAFETYQMKDIRRRRHEKASCKHCSSHNNIMNFQ